MKVTKEFTKLEKSAVKLTATIAKEDVESGYKETLSKYVKNAQIPGFRKGHVPAAVLERKYGDGIKADVAEHLVNDALTEVFEKETENRPLPYSQPTMDKLPELDPSKEFSFTVTYDVFPKVVVKDLSGIVVKEPQISVGAKELDDELKAIQERNAVVMDKKDDEPVEKGNIVTINYSETDDEGNTIDGSKREGFVFTVGSGENIYELDKDIIGMKKNDTKEIVKKYPKTNKNKDLAGTTKKISVTVTAVKTKDLPALDDDLAQDVDEKYKTIDDLKKAIKENLNHAKDKKVAELKSKSLVDQIVEKYPFDLPAAMLKAELEGRWKMMAQQFQTTPEKLETMLASSGSNKEKMMEGWEKDSSQRLKGRIIVESLINDRNISVTPEEVEAQYSKIAEDNRISVEEVKKYYAEPQTKQYLIDDAKEQKLYDELFKEVKIEKGDKIAFADLFKNN